MFEETVFTKQFTTFHIRTTQVEVSFVIHHLIANWNEAIMTQSIHLICLVNQIIFVIYNIRILTFKVYKQSFLVFALNKPN